MRQGYLQPIVNCFNNRIIGYLLHWVHKNEITKAPIVHECQKLPKFITEEEVLTILGKAKKQSRQKLNINNSSMI